MKNNPQTFEAGYIVTKKDDQNNILEADLVEISLPEMPSKIVKQMRGEIELPCEAVNFKKYTENPIVVYKHGIHEYPIGKTSNILIEGKKLTFFIEFNKDFIDVERNYVKLVNKYARAVAVETKIGQKLYNSMNHPESCQGSISTCTCVESILYTKSIKPVIIEILSEIL